MTAKAFSSEQLVAALAADDASVRLAGVMAAGTRPNAEFVSMMVGRFGVEDDFFVRDMLTWALLQHDQAQVVAAVLPGLQDPNERVRAQSLHTLSKLALPETWSAITPELLADASNLVAQTAWRTAVILCPETERSDLAIRLCDQLGRGGTDVHLSLSSALVGLGEFAQSAVAAAAGSSRPEVAAHARATQQLSREPDLAFATAMERANRAASLKDAPTIDPELFSKD